MRFFGRLHWQSNSDGSPSVCYSLSSVVKKYFTPNTDYDLDDFVIRSRTALKIARDRVATKYGFPCGLALIISRN